MKKRKWILLVITIITPAAAIAGKNNPEEKSEPFTFRVSSYDQDRLVHNKSEPLHIELAIANPAAQNVQMEINRAKWLKDHPRPGATSQQLELIAKKANATSVPTITLGSRTRTLTSLLTFTLIDDTQKKTVIVPRLMADSDKISGAVVLDATNTVHLSYGVDPKQLAPIADGHYVLKAVIDSHNDPGSWQGNFASNAVALTLSSKPESLSKEADVIRLYRIGKFYLEDKKYDQVLRIADQIQSVDPDSSAGLELKGDACAGQGKLNEAKQAYESALDKIAKQVQKIKVGPNTLIEPPEAILDKLSKVLEGLNSASNH